MAYKVVLLLLAALSLCSTQTTQYVKPSVDTHCPGDPCLTLSEYVQDSFLYFNSDTAMVFLPGDHDLEGELYILAISNFTMRGSASSFPNITSRVVCTGIASILMSSVSDLLISNLAFISCRTDTLAVFTITSVDLQLLNCSFHDNTNLMMLATDSSILMKEADFSSNSAGFLQAESSTVVFSDTNKFSGNQAYGPTAALISMQDTNVSFDGQIVFADNSFDVSLLTVERSNLSSQGSSSFINNLAIGRILLIEFSTAEFTGNITFYGNLVTDSIINSQNSNASFSGDIQFHNNSVTLAVLYARTSTLSFVGRCSVHNTKSENGFGVYTQATVATFSGSSRFTGNSVGYGGGLYAVTSNVTFCGSSNFSNNSAVIGAAIFSDASFVSFQGNTSFVGNQAAQGGAIHAYTGGISFSGNSAFISNTAQGTDGGGIYSDSSTLTFNGSTTSRNNKARSLGGVVAVINRSNFTIIGNSHFADNSAGVGGSIAVSSSYFDCDANSVFVNNMAVYGGGALAVLNGTTSFSAPSNFTTNHASGGFGGGVLLLGGVIGFTTGSGFTNNTADYGGAIHTSMGTLLFSGYASFTSNIAINGGALSLADNSRFYLPPNTTLDFQHNHAQLKGGAIAVGDDLFSFCVSDMNLLSFLLEYCFFQLTTNDYFETVSIVFKHNHAGEAGDALYGGLLDKCTLDRTLRYTPNLLFTMISTGYNESNSTSHISSVPMRVCHCKDSIPDCTVTSTNYTVYPGQTLEVPVVAVGQRNGTVPSIVRSSLSSQSSSRIGSLEMSQQTGRQCTILQYTVFSRNSFEEITLLSDNPCADPGTKLTVYTDVLPCPPGFELSNLSAACVCDVRLQPYTNSCNISDATIERTDNDNFWVGFDVKKGGVILHSQCTFDYCRRDTVRFTLNGSGSDAQCNNNRSGLLCGGCQSGLSLTIGSSQCLKCSNEYLALLIPFALAGITLVALIFICKLTVTTGIINGLVFFANIVQAHRAIFFPRAETNILTVFIAWINLDLGIETCFYDGMDAYAKTWLQYVFPLYIWLLVGLIILASHYSSRITHFLGNRPVSVLATLFLLSYTKILRTSFAALALTELSYPNKSKIVWTYDGNLQYLAGRHIALFLVALLTFVLVLFPYMVVLFFAQWLQAQSNHRMLSWLNSIKPVLDAYQAPYKIKYRYWTGLLLLVRFSLLLVSTVNSTNDPSINLLILSACCLLLAVLAWNAGRLYTNWYLDTLESFFILMLGVLAAGTYYVRATNNSQAALTYTLVGMCFVVFIGILALQIFSEIRRKFFPGESFNISYKLKKRGTKSTEYPDQQLQITTTIVEPPVLSSTTVFLREPLLEES